MTIQIRPGSTNTSSNGSGSTATGTVPAATQPGDLVIATVQVAAAQAALDPVRDDWFAVDALNAASTSSSSLRAAQHRAVAGVNGSTVEFALGVSSRWTVNVEAFFDDGGTPVTIEQAIPYAGTALTGSPSTPAATPFGASTMLVAVIGGTVSVVGETPTVSAAAAGHTLRTQGVSTAATLKNAVQAVATRSLTGTTAIPAATHTLSAGTVSVASATLILSSVNAAPVAVAGPDQTVTPGSTVTLNGAASVDPDGAITAYQWTQVAGPSVTLSSTAAASPTFTAPSYLAGVVLTFGLLVTDDRGSVSSQDTVSITVGPAAAVKIHDGVTWGSYPVRGWESNAWV